MCRECGCGGDGLQGQKPHEHGQKHNHEHPHEDRRTIVLEQRILARNDEIAAENRAWLTERGVTTINFISAPGSGKTLLLERTLERLKDRVKCAVITGDVQTDNDARRLEGKGAVVRQIQTAGQCHLDATQIRRVLPEVALPATRLLFIENVGNLVCPTAFDLGESFKVALMSVAEGEDKPVKYPALFVQAPVVVLTKIDLLPYLDFDVGRCRAYLQKVHPGVFLFELSAKTGEGMDTWVDYLVKLAAV